MHILLKELLKFTYNIMYFYICIYTEFYSYKI